MTVYKNNFNGIFISKYLKVQKNKEGQAQHLIDQLQGFQELAWTTQSN